LRKYISLWIINNVNQYLISLRIINLLNITFLAINHSDNQKEKLLNKNNRKVLSKAIRGGAL
jgi:hypothetical protein